MLEPSRSKRRCWDMLWKPIVVGVDAWPEAADAAVFAVAVAHRAETSCHLVHATPASGHTPRRDSYPYTRRYELASVQVAAALGNRVPGAGWSRWPSSPKCRSKTRQTTTGGGRKPWRATSGP